MKELTTSIVIDAPAARVWRILTDFPRYPEWNPLIRSITGEPRTGEKLELRMEPRGGRAMTFKPTVLRADPEQELRWLGRLLLPGVFDGEHILRLEPGPDGGVTFLQHEVFRGLLVPVLSSMLDRTTRPAFQQMNLALKHRAEGTTQEP
jgi:hypothetical protein